MTAVPAPPPASRSQAPDALCKCPAGECGHAARPEAATPQALAGTPHPWVHTDRSDLTGSGLCKCLMPMGDPVHCAPQVLAAELETEAARLTAISSPHGKIGETRAHLDVEARAEGLRDAARTIRERLAPAWDALAAELAGVRAAHASLRREHDRTTEQRNDYMTDLAVKIRERDDALRRLGAQHEAMTQMRADHREALAAHGSANERLRAEATGLRVSLESAARDQRRFRAVLEEIRDGDSKYGNYARQLSRETLGGAPDAG